MYSAPNTQPHTRQTTPISPTAFPYRTVDSFPAQFSQLTRDNRELEARARDLAAQMKKFQGKLSEVRGLERDLAERDEEVKLLREENERMRRDLAQAWVREKGEGQNSDAGRLRSALKAAQERLAGLAQAARLFLQQTAQIPMPERDSMWTQLMENLAFELEKSLSSPRFLSRGPSPGRSPFESTTYESKHSEVSRNSPELEFPRLVSEPGQADTMQLSPQHMRDVHRLKGLVGELQRRNEALEATVEQLEGRLGQEEQLKGEREALERDCEELKQENVQFIDQLEWLSQEQTTLQQTLASYAETARSALNDFYEECLSAHQACLSPLLPHLNSTLAKVTALTSQVAQHRPAQLRKALETEIKRAENCKTEAEKALEACRSRVAALEKAETVGKSEIRALKAKLVAVEGEKKTLLEGKDKEIADLQAKLRDFLRNNEERKSLKVEIASLRRQLDSEKKHFEVQLQETTQTTLKTCENARIRLETDLKSLQREVKRLEALLRTAEMEGKAAKEELVQAKQTFQVTEMRLKAQITAENEKKAQIEAESVRKSAELKKLQSKLASAQITEAKRQQNLRNIKEIATEMDKLRLEAATFLQSTGQMLASTSTELLSTVAVHVNTHESAILQLQSELRQLQEENSALGSENSFLNQETEHLKTDLEREKQSKAHHSTAIAEANSAMKAIHASWQVSSQEYQEVYELAVALQIQLRETELRREEYREQTGMMAEDWTRWGERVVPLTLYKTQVKRLEKENERKERELDQVTESLFQLVRQQEEQQELLSQKERGLNRAEEERFRLEQLLSSSRKMALEEVESLNQELMQLKEQLSKKDFLLEKLAALRRSLETRNSDLQAKLTQVQNPSLEKSLNWPKGRRSKD